MAFHPSRGLLDPYGGREDLSRGVIRAVGDPMRRFGEDALRTLRAVRFACRLGFEIEPATQGALEACAHELDAMARERVGQELNGIMFQFALVLFAFLMLLARFEFFLDTYGDIVFLNLVVFGMALSLAAESSSEALMSVRSSEASREVCWRLDTVLLRSVETVSAEVAALSMPSARAEMDDSRLDSYSLLTEPTCDLLSEMSRRSAAWSSCALVTPLSRLSAAEASRSWSACWVERIPSTRAITGSSTAPESSPSSSRIATRLSRKAE